MLTALSDILILSCMPVTSLTIWIRKLENIFNQLVMWFKPGSSERVESELGP